MGKKPTSNNFDALGSVFDFLFTEAKKKPDKRKPIKPSEFSGTDALADAAIAALERPGVFISNTVVDEFNRSLDFQLGVVEFDKAGGGKVKISSNNLIDILRDPQKAVSKALQKAEGNRRAMRATFLGEAMKEFVASGWAHKYGDIEARKAVYGASIGVRKPIQPTETTRQRKNREYQESYVVSKAFGEYKGRNATAMGNQSFMANRSTELMRRRLIKDSEWGALSEDDRQSFMTAVVNGDASIESFLKSRFGDTEGISRFESFKKKFKGTNVTDPSLYRALEDENLGENIRRLESISSRTTEQESQLQVYRKTRFLLNEKKARTHLQTELERIKKDLSSVSDPARKAALKSELKQTRSALRYLNGADLAGNIGKVEGLINSWRSVYGPGGSALFTSILTGDFFDDGSNQIARPNTKLKFKDGDFSSQIYVPIATNCKLASAYNTIGTSFYYMTPRSVFNTIFVNGEGFYYLMYRKIAEQKGLQEMMGKALGRGTDKPYTPEEFFSMFYNEDFASFTKNFGGKMSPDELKQFEKFFKSNENIKKLSRFFSAPGRLKQVIQNKINDLTAPLRRKFAEKFLMRFVTKYGGAELLGQWIAKGGINVMIKSIATGIAGALGVVATPLGSIIVTAITRVVTDLAMKAFAQMLIIGKYMFFGIIGLLALLLLLAGGAVKSFNRTTTTYSNETPGSIIQCSVYEETELEEGETPWGDTIIPPPSGESCIFGAGSFWCSQGYVDVEGWSHQNVSQLMPVDLTGVGYIYAPQFCGTGNCSITRIAVINCRDGSNAGGIVELTASDGSTTYLFKLLHVKPLAGLGEKLSGGQPVAVVQDVPEVERGWCWTGKHLHLETRQNGATVDPLELLQSFTCNVPDETGCANP